MRAVGVARCGSHHGKLAYPVDGRRVGLYYLTYFRLNGQGNTEIARACKLSDVVLRHLIIKHPPSLFNAMVGALGGEESVPASAEAVAAAEDAAGPDETGETDETAEADVEDSEVEAVEES